MTINIKSQIKSQGWYDFSNMVMVNYNNQFVTIINKVIPTESKVERIQVVCDLSKHQRKVKVKTVLYTTTSSLLTVETIIEGQCQIVQFAMVSTK